MANGTIFIFMGKEVYWDLESNLLSGKTGRGTSRRRARIRSGKISVRNQLGRWLSRRRLDDDLDDVNMPKYPFLGSGPMRDIMSNRVSPGRKAAVGAEELAVTSPKLELAVAISNGFPLDGGIKAAGKSLEDFAAGHAE